MTTKKDPRKRPYQQCVASAWSFLAVIEGQPLFCLCCADQFARVLAYKRPLRYQSGSHRTPPLPCSTKGEVKPVQHMIAEVLQFTRQKSPPEDDSTHLASFMSSMLACNPCCERLWGQALSQLQAGPHSRMANLTLPSPQEPYARQAAVSLIHGILAKWPVYPNKHA